MELEIVGRTYGVIPLVNGEEAELIVVTPKGNEYKIPCSAETAAAFRNGDWVRVLPAPAEKP